MIADLQVIEMDQGLHFANAASFRLNEAKVSGTLFSPQATVLFDSTGNCIQKLYGFEGFLQKIHCAGFEGLDARRNRPVTGDKNDRKGMTLFRQTLLEFETTQLGHLDVKYEAPRQIGAGKV